MNRDDHLPGTGDFTPPDPDFTCEEVDAAVRQNWRTYVEDWVHHHNQGAGFLEDHLVDLRGADIGAAIKALEREQDRGIRMFKDVLNLLRSIEDARNEIYQKARRREFDRLEEYHSGEKVF